MTRRPVSILSLAAAIAAVTVLAVIESTASAGQSPFVPVSAVGSIAALTNQPLAARPSVAARIGEDLQPADGRFYALGAAGYVWRYRHGVCVAMQSGSSGCFEQFAKPVVLYLTGEESSSGAYSNAWVEGVVPNTVVEITLLMDNGVSVPAPISENAFRVAVPAGVGIAGYTVTLRNGQSEQDSDPVALPNPAAG